MDSFKRLFRPVANAADATHISKKKNPFQIDSNDQEDGGTPNIHIQRHKIPTRSFALKMEDDIPRNNEEEEFSLRSGAILGSSSSNYSFVSSDGLDDQNKSGERKPPIEIKYIDDKVTLLKSKPQDESTEKVSLIKPKPRLYKTLENDPILKEDSGLETTNSPHELTPQITFQGDVLLHLKSLIYKYEDLIVDLDIRMESMHESLLCDLISRVD